ncbi:MAG: prepilin peptidase [Gemmatimonadota bacterium]|nr:MAG: prepilin peptidase [Gemmatimonadota bacterium]
MTVETLFYVTAGLLGAALGSFMNVCIYRLPHGESVVRPRSFCPGCGKEITARDNIPVLSWLFLRGRCRQCGERISFQYPLVELATIGIWLGMALGYGPTLRALAGAIFFTLLLSIAITDARHYLIPDELSIGGLASGLALAVLTELVTGVPTILASVAGAALGFLLLLGVGLIGDWVFKKPAMGGGDMKMMAMIGAYLGPVGAVLTIFLGALAGSLIFGPISLRTGKMVPFGVFLALGGAVTFLLGDALIDWYRGTFLPA